MSQQEFMNDCPPSPAKIRPPILVAVAVLTAAILWALQDNIARIDEFKVGWATYAITRVDYDAPTAAARTD